MSKIAARKKINYRKVGRFLGKPLLLMLGQLFPVAIGVFWGTIASDWNTQKKQRATQKEFLTNLSLEIQSNKSKMQYALAYHTMIKHTADSARRVTDNVVLKNEFWA